MKLAFKIILLLSLVTPVLTAFDCGEQIETSVYNNFVLVADRSGSMNAQSALIYSMVGMGAFLKSMHAEDWVSLVTFSDDVRVDQEFTRDINSVFNKVKEISPEGRLGCMTPLGRRFKCYPPGMGVK